MKIKNRKAVMIAATSAVVAATALMCTERKRSQWMKPWLQRRESGQGILNMVHEELRVEDPDNFRNYLRMSEENFEDLLNLVKEDIQKEDTYMRSAISARDRLSVTLRFLATGETFQSISLSTRIHVSTISKIVPEVVKAIHSKLIPLYVKCPRTEREWIQIAEQFEKIWSYPACLGAIDGKHVVFRAPASAGSYFYNYKGSHSIVLLAVVDAESRFIYVDVGVNGRVSDGGVLRQSSLYRNMGKLNFPPPKELGGSFQNVPYHFVGDGAFSLSERLMKPYPMRGLDNEKRAFNYRLSRARRCAENAFGILANRFRVLLAPINLGAEKVEEIVLAIVGLHNFLAIKNRCRYMDSSGDSSVELPSLGADPAQRSSVAAQDIRRELTVYFNHERNA